MNPQNAPRTARERARAELTREIKEEARRQLAAVGANGLSLRAVARELGMVSSALYRYYPSRDDLLTALIIDAYNAIGEAAETAIGGVRPGAGDEPDAGYEPGVGVGVARARWLAACHAIRAWAIARPHEYALIYGSPVPGYRAPQATVGPAARVPLAFVGVLAGAIAADDVVGSRGSGDSHADADAITATGDVAGAGDASGMVGGVDVNGGVDMNGAARSGGVAGTVGACGASDPSGPGLAPVVGVLADQAAALSAGLLDGLAASLSAPSTSSVSSATSGDRTTPALTNSPAAEAPPAHPTPVVPPDVLVRAVIAWTQLIGMISFELFGQFVGSFEPADALFAHTVAQFATFVGLS